MAVRPLVNAAADPFSELVAAAIMAALGRRPDHEDWMVSILRDEGRGCIVNIDRPDGGSSRWQFEECSEEPIRDTIREDLRREGYSWL